MTCSSGLSIQSCTELGKLPFMGNVPQRLKRLYYYFLPFFAGILRKVGGLDKVQHTGKA